MATELDLDDVAAQSDKAKRELKDLRDTLNAVSDALDYLHGMTPQQAADMRKDASNEGLCAWQPIATAPAGIVVVVGWLDDEDAEHPERHAFDWLDEGCWQKWHDRDDYLHMIGAHGVTDTPPYSHWLKLPDIPRAPNG